MYISLTDSRTKRFRKWSDACAPEIDPEIDKDVRADEGDGEIVADPDLNKRVTTSPSDRISHGSSLGQGGFKANRYFVHPPRVVAVARTSESADQ